MKGFHLFISLVIMAIIISISLFFHTGITTLDSRSISSNGVVRLVNIYDIVNEAFLYENGYDDKMSLYMSKDVFDIINIYEHPNLKGSTLANPLVTDFNLEELNQKEDENDNTLYYIHMNYSVDVKDGSYRVFSYDNKKITFKVRYNGSAPYIESSE